MRMCCSVVLLACLPVGVWADEKDDLEKALALQETIRRVVKRAEPTVACLYVSRSKAYEKLAPKAKGSKPGELGGFDREAAKKRLEGSDPDKARGLVDLDLADPKHVPESFGCGILLDKSGLVLTPAHVVDRATKVFVRLPNGEASYANIHALDPRSDLAIVKMIDAPKQKVQTAKLGDGGGQKKGSIVVQVSNPFNDRFDATSPDASWGLVSNIRQKLHVERKGDEKRNRQLIHEFGTLLQYEAKIQLPCSGAGLFDLKGELVGLATTYSVAGVGSGHFAIPLDESMKRIVAVLLRGEEVEYGFLGVQIPNRFVPRFGQPARKGVYIDGVAHGSPAQQGGLRSGDTVVSIDGRPVEDDVDLFLLIGTRLAGGTTQIEVERFNENGTTKKTVVLGKYWVQLPFIASKRPPAPGGMRIDYNTIAHQRSRRRWLRNFVPDGVIVREVLPGSPAEKAKFQIDDIITQVQGRAVRNPAEYYEAMKGARGKIAVTVRGGDGQYQTLTLDLRESN